MTEFVLAWGLALWLGVLTSISPCPLATNIAAISYIGKRVERPALVFWSGAFYTFGRTLTYTALGMLLVAGLLAIPELSLFLQTNMNKILGPLLIVAGVFLLGLIKLNFGSGGFGSALKDKAQDWGVWGAGALGILFALSFCPVSAALFFGSLIPLAVKFESGLVIPALYGIGTAVPVVAFAVLLGVGMHSVSKWFQKLTQVELWARRITGAIFILVGFCYILTYIFGLSF
ncbi:MAG: aromatic aminobenezylarsenical efflux permease ArsG family transporter [Alphaproteobacteria bacterium]